MKKLLIGLLALGSISTSASVLGLPDQDPIVKNLRAQFRKATLPTVLQLQQGKTWFCSYYFADKDNFIKLSNKAFYKFGASESYLMNVASELMGEYVISDDGLSYVGLNRNGAGDREFLRVTSGGDIIAEYVDLEIKENQLITVPAAADPHYRTVGYTICPKSLSRFIKE